MSDTNPSLLIVYIHGFGTTGLSSYKYGLIQKFTEKHSWINSVALEWQPNQLHITDALISQLTNHLDRKSTRLNSSHVKISYAVFCLNIKKYLISNEVVV